jgi:predicted LPLAT superfamily acyltransferase
MRTERGTQEWIRRRERGSMAMLRTMTFISLHLGRRPARVVLYGIAAYFFVLAPTARRHMNDYLRRVFGRRASPLARFRLLLSFASTIHDRVFLLRDQHDRFDLSVEGEAAVKPLIDSGAGAFLMGAHMGSFEVIRAVGRRRPGLNVAMAMYEENAHKINAMLAAINPRLSADIIPLGTMDSMLQIRARLAAGAFVGVLGDRTFGDEPTIEVEFLGSPARFPTGAMRVAALLQKPVIFMTGLYRGGNRYHVVFEKIADFSQTEPAARGLAVDRAIRAYAQTLERHCRRDPYNWFNFFDFWQTPPAPARVSPRT